jgi:type II secretory pathway pseudopilin PulG
MLSNFPIRSIPQRKSQSQRGYILITLLLFVALLAIAAAAIVPTLTFQIKRDREEEMIHRGAQYTRAVRRYFKKFGRYPTRIEDLVTTNNVHYLRKAYKDPITGKDFKLLHMGDIQMSVFGAGGPPNGMTGNPGAAANAGFTQAIAGAAAVAGQQAAGQTNLNPAQPADNSNQADTQPAPGDDTPGGPDIAGGGATDSSSSSSSGNAGKPNSSGQGGFGSPSAQTFGGGPIVGVASISKAKSIRVFNKKDHYDKWQFYYDPSSDRGGLISTPNQPPLMQGSQVGQPINGQPGSGNSSSVNSGNGQANGIGNSVGFGGGGNQPNSATPQQPAQEPQQTPDQQ